MAVTSLAKSQQNRHAIITLDKSLNETIKPNLPTLNEFLSARRTDVYCDIIRPTVGIPGSSFDFDKNELLVRLSPIDDAIQNVLPQLMGPTILRLVHRSTIAGCPVELQIYDTLRRKDVWHNISSDEYSTVRHYDDCPWIVTSFKHQRQ